MSEHQADPDPYWTADVELGDVPLRGESTTVCLRLRESDERFTRHGELVPLTQTTGTRRYIYARPYVLEPDIRLTVALSPTPRPDGAIGRVSGVRWAGMRHREVGQAQAWYYPADALLVLWECYLYDAAADPRRGAAGRLAWLRAHPAGPAAQDRARRHHLGGHLRPGRLAGVPDRGGLRALRRGDLRQAAPVSTRRSRRPGERNAGLPATTTRLPSSLGSPLLWRHRAIAPKLA